MDFPVSMDSNCIASFRLFRRDRNSSVWASGSMWLEWDMTSWKESDTQLKSSWLFKTKVFWWGTFYLTIFKLILLKYETQFALESTLFRTNQKSNCKWFHYMREKIKYGSKLLLRDKDSKVSAISVYFLLIWQGFFFFYLTYYVLMIVHSVILLHVNKGNLLYLTWALICSHKQRGKKCKYHIHRSNLLTLSISWQTASNS